MIESYSFGSMVVDGEKYSDDLMIHDGEVKSGWVRGRGHLLRPGDLTWIVDRQPDLLVVGTGSSGRMRIGDGVGKFLADKGIDIWSGKTKKAADHFNDERKERGEEEVAGAFHLTC